MRRNVLRLLTALLTLVVAFTGYLLWWERHPASWPYTDALCGVSDTENPLCAYSASLSEIPTIDFCSVVNDPQAYDRKIIRIRGNFSFGEVGNFSDANLQNPACESYHHRIGANYWNGDTISNLGNYLDVFAPTSRRANVTVVGQFLDRAGHGYETMGGDRFLFIILHTESMSPAAPVPPNKALQLTAR
jgi:hypothetical protein